MSTAWARVDSTQFVMAQTYANLARHHGDVKGIVGHTLAETGPSITFTSMTNLVAFLIASVTPIQVMASGCDVFTLLTYLIRLCNSFASKWPLQCFLTGF